MKRRKDPKKTPPASAEKQHQAATSFKVLFTTDAAADIKALDGSIKQRLQKVLIAKFATNPGAYGLPLRAPLAGYWKHEFADHRIVYKIYPDIPAVAICAIGPRKSGDTEDVYNQLQKVVDSGILAEQVASVLRTILPKDKP